LLDTQLNGGNSYVYPFTGANNTYVNIASSSNFVTGRTYLVNIVLDIVAGASYGAATMGASLTFGGVTYTLFSVPTSTTPYYYAGSVTFTCTGPSNLLVQANINPNGYGGSVTFTAEVSTVIVIGF
jgi:predicted phage tail protein